ncbi:MAG: hypothetical protein KJI69_06425, partial [Patescibacteria group bacterium]|nr:hypothetical protein [Patescibacteria group bacterium]
MLKKLTDLGDLTAKKVFKEESAQRYEGNYGPVKHYLTTRGYLEYLTKSELKSINAWEAFNQNKDQ